VALLAAFASVAACACCIALLNHNERPVAAQEAADADTESAMDPHRA
jgi:hypothetical protein